jgi:hypothetical protein
MNLDNIKLGYSPLSDSIYLYRHGKDEHLALEKREAESEVMGVLVKKLMHDAPNGSHMTFGWDDKAYEITLKPISKDE